MDDQFAFLLQAIFQSEAKSFEGRALFALQKLLLDLVDLLGEVFKVRCVVRCHAVDEPVAANLRGWANLSNFHPEGSFQQLGGAEVLYGARSGEGLGSCNRKAQRFGSLVERFAALNALCEIIGFSPSELDGFFLLVIRQDAVANFRQRPLMRRLDVFRSQDHEALRNLERLAKLTGVELGKRLMQFRSVSEVANGFGNGDQWRFAELKIKFLCEIVQRLTV